MRNKIHQLTTASIVFGAACLTGTALGKSELQCNKKQTKCVTESTNISIGDEVGVFNQDGELVATGEVTNMKGERRAVIINKRHGSIHGNYNLALLETKTTDTGFKNAYTVYQEPAKLALGAEAGLSTWAIGEQTPAAEYSVFAQWRKWGGLQLIARGVFTAMEGRVSRYGATNGLDEETVSVKGGGLLGGVGYVVRDGKTLSFRGELAAGGMYVSADVGGDAALVNDPEFQVRLKNGLNPYGRGSLGALLTFGAWHVHADFAESLVARASGTTLAAGVSKDLK